VPPCPPSTTSLPVGFYYPLSPTPPGACLIVANGLNTQTVVWECAEPGCGSCGGGDPQFLPNYIMEGGSKNCYSNEWATILGRRIDLTYATCNTAKNAACMFTSTYYPRPGENITLNSQCTTGGNISTPSVTFGVNGQQINGQRQPNSTGDSGVNVFASGNATGPFNVNQCITAPRIDGIYRSYKVYCDECQVPSEYQGLPVHNQYSTIPVTTAPVQTTNLQFEPPIAQSCIEVLVANTTTSPTIANNQPFMVFWSGAASRFGTCTGNASFLAAGGSDNCFQANFPASTFGIVSLTSMFCSPSTPSKACMWTSMYQVSLGAITQPNPYVCTTGNGLTSNGAPFPPTQPADPDFPGNQFAVSGISSLNAPFNTNQCYTPARPAGFPYRSYRVYCNYDDIPISYRSLPLQLGPVLLQ